MATRPGHLKAALTAARLAARRTFAGSNVGRQQELAEMLSDQLDEMKGLAMKLGQIVSYMDVPLAPEVQEKLVSLQTGSRGQPLSALRSAFIEDFGRPPAELFDSIEEDPVCAASIGQVHRARFEGRTVAVKVQYPHVAEGFKRDLGFARRLAGLSALASSVDGASIVDEIGRRLDEECDYTREAHYQSVFKQNFSSDAEIVVPTPVFERSGAHVLTSEWVQASPFSLFCDRATDEERTSAAEVLTRFSYRGLLIHGLIQADPHPGNFSFFPGGKVVFFDYGCVKELPPSLVESLRALARALLNGDRAAVRQAAFDLGMVGNPKRFDHDEYFEMMRHLFLPFIEPRFSFTPAYVKYVSGSVVGAAGLSGRHLPGGCHVHFGAPAGRAQSLREPHHDRFDRRGAPMARESGRGANPPRHQDS